MGLLGTDQALLLLTQPLSSHYMQAGEALGGEWSRGESTSLRGNTL